MHKVDRTGQEFEYPSQMQTFLVDTEAKEGCGFSVSQVISSLSYFSFWNLDSFHETLQNISLFHPVVKQKKKA